MRRLRHQKLSIPLLAAAILSFVILVIIFSQHYSLQKKFDQVAQEFNSLKNQNDKLQSMLNYFDLNANIEREARSQLNLSKQGEVEVVFVSPSPSPTANPNSSGFKNFWQKLWPF